MLVATNVEYSLQIKKPLLPGKNFSKVTSNYDHLSTAHTDSQAPQKIREGKNVRL